MGTLSRSRADSVAEQLRQRILTQAVGDGEKLPRLEDLAAEFGISRPTMRDALRILETEGLATVRRGRFGGAVVHRPQTLDAAHSLGLVLRGQDVGVDDLTVAMRHLDHICAQLCAGRTDRHEVLVPALWEVHEQSVGAVGDGQAFGLLSTRFHELLLTGSGNATITLVVGALQVLWTAHAAAWADQRQLGPSEFPSLEYQRRSLADHELLIRHIDRGDADIAATLARRHLDWTTGYLLD
ncbi:MAG: GntR family transcriptional regulator [Actinomycetota bacterium]|nr:GntR family transcriptional regulator [Actinomycetota bacterium]